MTSSACPPWCIWDPCEGNHASRPEPVPTNYVVGDEEDEGEPLVISVQLTHDQDGGEDSGPHVTLFDNNVSIPWGVDLTVAQARELAAALTRHADLLEPS